MPVFLLHRRNRRHTQRVTVGLLDDEPCKEHRPFHASRKDSLRTTSVHSLQLSKRASLRPAAGGLPITHWVLLLCESRYATVRRARNGWGDSDEIPRRPHESGPPKCVGGGLKLLAPTEATARWRDCRYERACASGASGAASDCVEGQRAKEKIERRIKRTTFVWETTSISGFFPGISLMSAGFYDLENRGA
jgi:hypothetical protein